jgi:hypothetical protein
LPYIAVSASKQNYFLPFLQVFFMSFKKLFATAFSIGALASTAAYAQLPAGSFGLSAAFATSGATQAQFLFAPSSNFQLDFGVGYMNQQIDLPEGAGDDPDPMSTIAVNLGGKVFLSEAVVSPFVGLGVSYSMGPNTTSKNNNTTTEVETSGISGGLNFGAQSFISKNVALFGMVGFGYGKSTQKTTTTVTVGSASNSSSSEMGTSSIGFTGSALGVSFYF